MIRRDQERKELRSLKLNSASLSITDGFADWFGQRRYRIRYDADGDYFRIWVSDDKRPGVEIELESRSKGFQWFFSFYLVFLFESDEGHKNAVLLLDEPGLNLHPTAQQKLISFFDRLSENNTLLYSTHSPFLIDPKNLHRVSPVFEDETGHSRVVSDGWPADRETTFALQAAAGYNVMQALFRSPKNVLVEDIGHHIYLQILAVLCRAAGFDAIPEDVQVTACGGTRLMAPIAALFATAETQTLVLLDDGEGARRRTPLNPSALLQHAGSGVLTVSEAIGATHVDIEDVFGEGVIVPMVAELLGQDFVLEDADRRQGALVDQIVASATRQQILLPDGWRADVARRVAYVWQTRWPEEIPPEVLERAQVLFRAINARLGIDLFNLVL
nr:AAA family ATPase [Prosthecomicrobium hirschii]